MEDEGGVALERPKKAKRTKGGSKPLEDIPMSTMNGSNKFNELLQQAVDQSFSDVKAEKKKKKKKGGDPVLESLRKGEGLEKDLDETKLANTYDPDDDKYEKSNKRKQTLIEAKNRQNELEIVDETKGKTKKKKKAKSQDVIENVDESQFGTEDKTMTLAELDASVAKTPGKKKKTKKHDDETILSARSEDEPSVITTPKKKPRKKTPMGSEADMTGADTDTVLTHTKKKKSKSVTQETDTTHDQPQTTAKKKKKTRTPAGAESDEDALSPSEDVVSPGRGKKKKKKTTAETDEDTVLSATEEPLSPKRKKGKTKKKGEEEIDQEIVTEEPSTSTGKKGKKKKKGGQDTEDEALSPSEDVASPRTKDKKKKKKKDKETTGEEEVAEEEEEDKAPKAKERKKKKKAGAEEEIEAAEDDTEPSGRDVEDEGRILSVTIHRTDKLKNDFYILHPMVRVHIFDELTGKYLPKQHMDRAVTAYYELKNENVKHVLPIMTKPFDFKQNKSVLPVWEELLVFNENYNYFIQEKPKVLVIFELVDFVSMNRASQNDEGFHRIAWAFLKILGNNQKINTGSKVRLQLFEAPQSSTKKSSDGVEQFMWWKSGGRKTYPSTLYVTLKGIIPPREVEPAERSLFATQMERGRMSYQDLKRSANWTGKKEMKPQRTMSSWSRLAGQLCRLPNMMYRALPTAKKGCYVVRFSHDGRSIACACQGKEGYPILVYEIPSGQLRGKFMGHFGIVYDMSWSKMDTHLLTASSDGTARVWDLEEFGEQQHKLLPHPAFVYCSQFHPRVDSIAVTGSYDQVIRVWDVSDDGSNADLRQELESHAGYVNSICFAEDGQKMYTADSAGIIIIWNSHFTEMPSKRGIERDWTLFKRIEDADIKGTAINFIQLHPRERRLLVHTRDNVIRMFDLRIERVMQRYIGALNFREQIRSAISPCGSFVFAGSEDNFAYAWNTDTGDQVVMYSDLNYQNPVTDVHYHPRDHMVAFCSLGENHPVIIYGYDPETAQFEAGLSPRQISPVPADDEMLGTARLQEELASKGVLSKDEFQLHSTQRYDKVMKTLNKVTAQMTGTPTLDLPGMTLNSPRNTMMTMGSGTYDMYGSPRTMTGSPTMFSPHAQRSMDSTARHQQFSSQSLYMKGVDSWRPTFSEVGRHGRSTSPVLGRTPQLNMTATQQGKAQFNFQAPPGRSAQKTEKVVALYDYKAQRSDELDIFAGDEIIVLYRDTENWWMGELSDGQQGFFPSNYVTHEDLMDSHLTATGDGNMMDDSDTERKQKLTAVRTKTGELKFVSGEEDSGDDLLQSSRARRRKKRNSQDSGSSSLSQTNGKKPPRKTGQKVRINEDNNSESKA